MFRWHEKSLGCDPSESLAKVVSRNWLKPRLSKRSRGADQVPVVHTRSWQRVPSAPWPWPPASNHPQLCVRQRVDIYVCVTPALLHYPQGLRAGMSGEVLPRRGGKVTTFDLSPFLWTQTRSHSCNIQQVWWLIFSSELQLWELQRRSVSGAWGIWGSAPSTTLLEDVNNTTIKHNQAIMSVQTFKSHFSSWIELRRWSFKDIACREEIIFSLWQLKAPHVRNNDHVPNASTIYVWWSVVLYISIF